jgi:hypothetical protein
MAALQTLTLPELQKKEAKEKSKKICIGAPKSHDCRYTAELNHDSSPSFPPLGHIHR